ncbi:dienelactone hydrolase family protein [Nocardioides okcheonensis]|uniref:dienelactone hydrolase family protein n=1 Tax=Nocardioides okcheonensis TaxID=2894081 RepID=UPI001E4EA996|nr:dienelactone hydrolase family protein [Nocardioides okcheonensis]UFN45405.1 dienelactone hydrolase family protein [Nocardioides okcheonensis]
MDALETWTRSEHTADVDGSPTTHPVWRKGSGPGVVVVHEVPGLTTGVIAFGEELVEAGYTVLLPHLFGPVGRPFGGGDVLRTLPRLCVSREFTMLATGVTTPVAGWLRSLARELHAELGGPGVGALGMCFTGGFALAMMVDESVVAPVVCQPSVPFPVGGRRAADLNLSPADTEAVRRRASGCQVLGIRYAADPAVGTRFDTLTSLIGDDFVRVELPGKGHSTVTEQRSQVAVDAVLEFFGERLRA